MTRTTAQRTAWVAAAALLLFVLRLGLSGAASVGVGFAFVVPVGLATWWFGREIGLAVAVSRVALYLERLDLPPRNTACRQEVPF